MEPSIFDLAYSQIEVHYKELLQQVVRDVSAKYPEEKFDEIHHAGVQAIALSFQARKFSERVWGKALSYESAEKSLAAQFPEFSQAVIQRALGTTYSETR